MKTQMPTTLAEFDRLLDELRRRHAKAQLAAMDTCSAAKWAAVQELREVIQIVSIHRARLEVA